MKRAARPAPTSASPPTPMAMDIRSAGKGALGTSGVRSRASMSESAAFILMGTLNAPKTGAAIIIEPVLTRTNRNDG